MATKKALVVGCSITSGYKMMAGQDDLNHPRLWANQLLSKLDDFEIINRSRTGVNNHWIFMEAMSALTKDHYDLVVIQWTGLGRILLPVGLELYNTLSILTDGLDVNLVNGSIVPGKWLQDVGDRLKSFSNLHWDILNIVRYVNILIQIQQLKKSKICFVDSGLQWSPGYFEKKSITKPSELSKFEQHILAVEHRDDSEIFDLYNMIHNQYQEYGNIQTDNWLNLYQSHESWKVDTIAPDDFHPGYLSQDILVQCLWPALNEYYRK